ncbi:MAG: undecaprenyl-diphosphate phosphatase [Polyangiaceae bacterium]
MDVSLRDALVLGLVQGFTYVLPVSSDGHLALLGLVCGVELPSPLASVTMRAATLVATCIVLRQRIVRALREVVASVLAPSRLWTEPGGQDTVTVLLASLPTALFGVFLREPVSAWAQSPLAIGVGLLGTSAWLLSTHWLGPGRAESAGLGGALLIGTAQGLAVLPGLSRSAGTIVCALWLGVRPDRAFELSFLASLPALLAMVLLDGRSVLRAPPTQFSGGLLAGGFSLLGSLLALLLLERLVRRGRLGWLASWTLPLSLATLALALVWPR